MSNKKKSSVDWIIEKLLDDGIIDSMTYPYALSHIEQARAMHREEITQAYSDGLGNGMHHERGDGSDSDLDEHKYYDQTFKTHDHTKSSCRTE